MFVKVRKAFYTPTELGRLIGLSRQTVVAMYERGELDGHRTPGGHVRINASVVEGTDHTHRIPFVDEA